MLFFVFNFKFIVQKGKDHVLCNHFSRLIINKEDMGIKDEVVDVALFIINVVPTWATDIV